MAILHGTEVLHPVPSKTQVYKDTHVGEERLPLRYRSFISFMYGGRYIEDFDLIATAVSDRLQKPAYAEFEDRTTSYEVVDGQFYWGTHFTQNTLDFSLATDGITENELQDFINWFQPGIIRELVLAEHPNRGLWARVAAQPVYSFVPFEDKREVMIAGQAFETSSTIYKGEVTLSFVADDPFWHSRNNMIYLFYDKSKDDKFGSMYDLIVDILPEGAQPTESDPDFLKVILEDGLPSTSMVYGNSKTNIAYTDISYTASPDEPPMEDILIGEPDPVTIDNENPYNIYYCGTAAGLPKTTFTYKPQITNNYICYPLNKYSREGLVNESSPITNYIRVAENQMNFTIPALLMGYNEAVRIVKKYSSGQSVEELRAELREGIYEYYSRSWAMFVLTVMIENNLGVDKGSGALGANFQSNFISGMKYLISSDGMNEHLYDVTSSIDSKNGEVITNFTCRQATTGSALPSSIAALKDQPVIQVAESTEDMVRSDYLKLEHRNMPDEQGRVTAKVCSKLETDYPASLGGLRNLTMVYDYLYL